MSYQVKENTIEYYDCTNTRKVIINYLIEIDGEFAIVQDKGSADLICKKLNDLDK